VNILIHKLLTKNKRSVELYTILILCIIDDFALSISLPPLYNGSLAEEHKNYPTVGTSPPLFFSNYL
jgi:hypothetical protein